MVWQTATPAGLEPPCSVQKRGKRASEAPTSAGVAPRCPSRTWPMRLDLGQSAAEHATREPEAKVPIPVQLSVVVPAYREGKRIYQNIIRLLDELNKLDAPYE